MLAPLTEVIVRSAGVAVVVAAILAAGPLFVDAAPDDPELARGITLVDDGDYDSAILTLDTVARRLAADPGRTRDLSQAYLYLGIAYMGKGHEAAARAKFKEAVQQIKDLTLSPDKFPPKVIDVFESAKQEANATAAAAPVPMKEKKGGSGKLLLIGGGVAAAAGVALAAGGGGGGGGATATTQPSDGRNRLEFSGRLPNAQGGSYDNYTIVATRPGTLEARVTWTNGQIEIGISCCPAGVCNVGCTGAYTRTSNTSGVYTLQATPQVYWMQPYNNSGTSDTYTFVVLFP